MPPPPILDHISELSTILKTVYGEGLEQQQNLAAMLYTKLSQSQVRFGGNSYEFPARMVQTQSVGARGYRVGLPEPIQNIDVTARVRQKHIYGTFDITGPDIEKGKGSVNAFVNTQTDKMRSLTEMVKKDMNMQTYLDGTGVRATITVAVGGGVYTVDRIKYLRVGMHVNVIDADGVTVHGGTAGNSDAGDVTGQTYFQKRFTVLSINPATLNVTVGTADGTATVITGAAATDFFVRHKSVGAELIGLDSIVDDGVNNTAANVLQDIDRAASLNWRATVFASAVPRDISLQLLQIAMDSVEAKSGRRVDMLVGSYNARDRYLQLLVPQKRFTDLKLDGGFQVLEYNGRDFVVDVDCQDDAVYLLNRASIQKFGLFDLAFVEQGGGILKHDSLAAGDVFYGYLRALCNFGTTQANSNAKIVDITVDAGYIIGS